MRGPGGSGPGPQSRVARASHSRWPSPSILRRQCPALGRESGHVRQPRVESGVLRLHSSPDKGGTAGPATLALHTPRPERNRGGAPGSGSGLRIGGPGRPAATTPLRGRARAPSRAPAPRRGARAGCAAELGGRRAHERTPSPGHATRGEGSCPGGTKYIRSDFNGSRDGGGGYPPTTPATMADGRRVAAAAGLSTTGHAAPGALALVIVGLVAGHASTASALGPRRAQPGQPGVVRVIGTRARSRRSTTIAYVL